MQRLRYAHNARKEMTIIRQDEVQKVIAAPRNDIHNGSALLPRRVKVLSVMQAENPSSKRGVRTQRKNRNNSQTWQYFRLEIKVLITLMCAA